MSCFAIGAAIDAAEAVQLVLDRRSRPATCGSSAGAKKMNHAV